MMPTLRFSSVAAKLSLGGLAVAASLALAQPAAAQRSGDEFFSPSAWQIGGGVVVLPKFEGSNSYRAIAFPFIAPAGSTSDSGVIQVRSIDDVRLRLITGGGFEAGLLGGYRFGRDSADSPRLARFSDITGGLVLGGYGGYRAGSTFFSASYHHQVTGDDTGAVVRLMAEQTIKIDRGTKLVAGLGTSLATKEYMTSFFGVTAAQAGPLPVYSPGAGFKDVFASLTATIELDRSWTLYATGRYARLVGDAADSPITENANQFYAGLGLSFAFGGNR